MSTPIKELQAYIGHGNKKNRVKDDFYATPEHATRALLQREIFFGSIWEPACGDGAISKILKESGYNVYSTDLIDRGYGDDHYDFLNKNMECDNIITNPPFNLGTEFTIHALHCAKRKVAIFNKLSFLEGKTRRAKIFNLDMLKKVYVFSERVSFVRVIDEQPEKAAGMLAFAWFVFDKSYNGNAEIEFI